MPTYQLPFYTKEIEEKLKYVNDGGLGYTKDGTIHRISQKYFPVLREVVLTDSNGCRYSLRVKGGVPVIMPENACPTCGGARKVCCECGGIEINEWGDCPICGSQGIPGTMLDCPDCKGTGEVLPEGVCGVCFGSGKVCGVCDIVAGNVLKDGNFNCGHSEDWAIDCPACGGTGAADVAD